MADRSKKTLNTQTSNVKREIETMQARRVVTSKILGTQEEALNQRPTNAPIRLKDRKPELFQITGAEQIGKQVGTLTVAFIE